MVRSCKKKHTIRLKKTIKGGDCGCSGSSGLFKGGRSLTKRKRIKRRKTIKGGMNMVASPGLSSLSNWARYPLNSYTNDPSDPSKLINGRFSAVPHLSSTSGGGRRRRRKRNRSTKKQTKKMKGGNGNNNPLLSFSSSFGNTSNINIASNTLLGANIVNPPGFLQSASVVNAVDNNPHGYSDQNPYMV
jgi:hypothetical protein